MQLVYRCPRCGETQRPDAIEAAPLVHCGHCGWERTIAGGDVVDGRPTRCLCCGCEDLWRQKDFPQKLGLLMVGAGILLSTIAWANMEPALAIGILMGFALIDMVLFVVMPDVLVCYRCAARHRHAKPPENHPRFNLETHERYRQETIRLEEAKSGAGAPRGN
jgi:DNA-directed RNA polymerase subunit RPC12/RpoP